MNKEIDKRDEVKAQIAVFIKKFIASRYHLYISDKNAIKLTSGMISIAMDDIYNTGNLLKTSMFDLANKWFRTSNIRGTLHEHSVGGFIKFIDKNYNIFFFPKKGIKANILKIVISILKIR